jgi:hypothetical protein
MWVPACRDSAHPRERLCCTVAAKFERHWSVALEQFAIAHRLFVAMFINTGLIILLINARWASSSPIFFGKTVFDGKYDDFTSDWFSTVGGGIMSTLLVNTINPHVVPLIMCFVAWGKRRWWATRAKTQSQLDAVYEGGAFELAQRCKHAIARASAAASGETARRVCVRRCEHPQRVLLRSAVQRRHAAAGHRGGGDLRLHVRTRPLRTAHPVFSSANEHRRRYIFERISFLRYYAIPERMDASLALRALEALPWGVALHCAMAVWFFSAPPLFPAASASAANPSPSHDYGERINLVGTFPHAVIAVCMFAVLGARLVFKTVLGINMPLPGFMRVKETDTDAMAGAPTLTEARAAHRLESYSLASQRRFGDGAALPMIDREAS